KMAKNMVSEKTGNHVKIDFSTMSFKDPDVWGRAENHTDGTYTETIFDYENKQADNLVVQETRRKSMTGDDPLLLTRKIILNQMGAPEEVMIFDGSGRYKYHGKFIYDSMGRMVEEQLRDASGQPLRRTVQEYTATGEHLPLKTWDYVSSVPSDLRLVVTNSEEMYRDQLQEMNRQLEDAEGKGLFANRKKRKIEEKAREMQEQFSQRNAAPTQAPEIPEATATAAKEESGGKRFRLFGKRK
ncbi:MAG: hypothetical protein P1V20_05100, partial [Verrucomicrobiales bacterium]|nr:hypothetical protein [Verrucomicrobiales bacterium]